MQLEFDVADSIVATSGVFSVKLAKKGNGLGIIITGMKPTFFHTYCHSRDRVEIIYSLFCILKKNVLECQNLSGTIIGFEPKISKFRTQSRNVKIKTAAWSTN